MINFCVLNSYVVHDIICQLSVPPGVWFLARLYESTGRAIAVTPASASASALALASALASALLKC